MSVTNIFADKKNRSKAGNSAGGVAVDDENDGAPKTDFSQTMKEQLNFGF